LADFSSGDDEYVDCTDDQHVDYRQREAAHKAFGVIN